jgi:hypothetical protein
MEREQFDQYDIVCTTLDTAYGGFPLPQDLSSSLGDEKNPAVKDGNVVFETNVNSNWDVAFWNTDLAQPEIIDADPADDLNPIITLVGGQLYVFWESNRDGVWHIYYSTRDVVGVEPRSHRVLPDHVSLYVHPNPGNARFSITLDMPGPDPVKAGIYDLSGRLVEELYNGNLNAGEQSFIWEASENPSGIYLLHVESSEWLKTQKIVLLK